jgi:hypothetical protein
MNPTLNNKMNMKMPSRRKGKELAARIELTELEPIRIPIKMPINTAGRNSQRLTVI